MDILLGIMWSLGYILYYVVIAVSGSIAILFMIIGYTHTMDIYDEKKLKCQGERERRESEDV